MSFAHLKNHHPGVFCALLMIDKVMLNELFNTSGLAKLDKTKSIWLPAVLKIRRRLKFDFIHYPRPCDLMNPHIVVTFFFLFAQNYY